MTVSHVLSMLCEDICVVFPFEASMLPGKWHVMWDVTDYRVRERNKFEMVVHMFCIMFYEI